MLPDSLNTRNPSAFLRFLRSPVPWQHLYRRTLGRRHRSPASARWAILTGIHPSFDPLAFDPRNLTFIVSPDGTTRADPFLWSHDGERHLFFEEWPADAPCGHLSVMKLDANGKPAGDAQPIIRGDTHFSYPFVFEHAGELWMLPENSASGRLQLFRCTEFPHRWVPDRILMEGIRYADPTLFEHDGRWWLFLTLGAGFFGVNTNLLLFSADSPLSEEWTPHPMNPIVSGFHRSRPAGRLFRIGGRIFRPSQDCLKKYGHGLIIHEVTRLDSRHYEEHPVRHILPWNESIVGVHHLDVMGDMLAMDIHHIPTEPT